MTKEKILKATHWGDLKIGDSTIKCAVLEDGTRILTRATFVRAIGRKGKVKGGRAYDKEFEVPVFLTAKNLKPYVSSELLENSKPILFRIKKQRYIGYKAELLPGTCAVFIDADEAKETIISQKHIVVRCKILLRGLATVGIIGLVDEATGFQYERDRNELEKILEAYIAKELLPWAKRFPDEFYRQLFRLRGWQYSPLTIKRPQYVGKLTNKLVYEKLPSGVLAELRNKNPAIKPGYRKHRHHQFLTENIGNPHLERHIASITTLMRAASNWRSFERLFERAFPAGPQQQDLFPEIEE